MPRRAPLENRGSGKLKQNLRSRAQGIRDPEIRIRVRKHTRSTYLLHPDPAVQDQHQPNDTVRSRTLHAQARHSELFSSRGDSMNSPASPSLTQPLTTHQELLLQHRSLNLLKSSTCQFRNQILSDLDHQQGCWHWPHDQPRQHILAPCRVAPAP